MPKIPVFLRIDESQLKAIVDSFGEGVLTTQQLAKLDEVVSADEYIQQHEANGDWEAAYIECMAGSVRHDQLSKDPRYVQREVQFGD